MKQAAVLIAALAALGGVQNPNPIDIREWPVPWERTRPRDPYVAPDGRVWFVGQQGDYAAYFLPSTGEFKRYELEPGTGPHNLIVDREGFVWYAGNRRVPMANARPYGITLDSKGTPWVVLFGTNKIASVDPRTMELKEIALPRPQARPRRIAIASDDRIWYVDYRAGYLGRYDPATGEVREWPAPSGVHYAQHTVSGTSVDFRDLPIARWEVGWRAPPEALGPVVLHAAANAANDDRSELGDRVYTATRSIRPK